MLRFGTIMSRAGLIRVQHVGKILISFRNVVFPFGKTMLRFGKIIFRFGLIMFHPRKLCSNSVQLCSVQIRVVLQLRHYCRQHSILVFFSSLTSLICGGICCEACRACNCNATRCFSIHCAWVTPQIQRQRTGGM